MNEGEAHLLTTTQFEHYWPLIQAEMDKVRHTWELWWTKESFYAATMEGYMQAWAIGSPTEIHLVAFTQIVYYPANVMLRITLLIGNGLDKYYDIAEATIEKYARDRGCAYMEVHGRRGWQRRISKVATHGVMLTRKLDNLRMQ